MGTKDENDKKYKLYFKNAENEDKNNNAEKKFHCIFAEIGNLIKDVGNGEYNDSDNTIINYSGWKKFTDMLRVYIDTEAEVNYPSKLLPDINKVNEFDRELRSNLNAFYGIIIPDFIIPTLKIQLNKKKQFEAVIFSYEPYQSGKLIYNSNTRRLVIAGADATGDSLPDNRWA